MWLVTGSIGQKARYMRKNFEDTIVIMVVSNQMAMVPKYVKKNEKYKYFMKYV